MVPGIRGKCGGAIIICPGTVTHSLWPDLQKYNTIIHDQVIIAGLTDNRLSAAGRSRVNPGFQGEAGFAQVVKLGSRREFDKVVKPTQCSRVEAQCYLRPGRNASD